MDNGSQENLNTFNPEENESEPQYDALLVLGACMKWDENKKEWAFPTWVPEEIYKPELVMGKARAIATSAIEEQAEVILVTGGPQKNPETGEIASRAVELSRLITEYGVSPEKVVAMGKGGNTLKNAEDTAAYLKDHPEIIRHRKIGVLSPRFQQERAKEMFDQDPYFKENGIEVDWIIVDDILEGRNPHYKKWIEALYKNPKYQGVLESEKKGLEDLKSGTYKPKQ